jgi:hypothetical protein
MRPLNVVDMNRIYGTAVQHGNDGITRVRSVLIILKKIIFSTQIAITQFLGEVTTLDLY